MTMVKKNYASIQYIQEGNLVPKDKQLDVKGINCMAKSSMSENTRNALKKILLEDILKADTISQLTVIKHLAILEKKIIKSIMDGSTEYYKPVTIKSLAAYEDPMRIQGIKASVVWNKIKTDDFDAIDLNERNAINVAKCDINTKSVEDLKEDFPEIYNNAVELLKDPLFKGKIDSIAIPLNTPVPEWLLRMVDCKTIVNDNISGFPIESIGIERLGDTNVNYTNIIQL